MNSFNSFAITGLFLALFALIAFFAMRIPLLRSRAQSFLRVFRHIRHASFMIACVLLLFVMFVFVPTKVSAQPAGTNTAGYGVHQFNDALIPPLAPSRTLSAQLALGINTGTCVATTDGTVTNTFSTNYVYSAPPVVIATQRGAALNTSTNIVVSVTTTNFVLKSGLASTTNFWMAIGQ